MVAAPSKIDKCVEEIHFHNRRVILERERESSIDINIMLKRNRFLSKSVYK